MNEIPEPDGRFTMKGTITFPVIENEKIVERAVELIEKPIPWNWIFLGGSVILSLIVLAGRR